MGEVPWYVMRYLPGGSVRDLKMNRDRKGQIQWDTTSFDWLVQIASALDYLHGRNCFHRDVKPENILFSGEGTPYLVDFGIVKSVSETTTMITEQGKAVGTLAYMAPEILEGGKFTAQSDQYALAATLYESITGDRPFSGTTYFALFKSIQKGHQKMTDRLPKMPVVASDVIDQALSEEPGRRFDSCGALASQFIAGLRPGAASVESPTSGGNSREKIADPSVAAPVKPKPPENPAGGESRKQAKPIFAAPKKPATETKKPNRRIFWVVSTLAGILACILVFVFTIYPSLALSAKRIESQNNLQQLSLIHI